MLLLHSRPVTEIYNEGSQQGKRVHGKREQAYNGTLGAEPPAGSRGKAPGQGGHSETP